MKSGVMFARGKIIHLGDAAFALTKCGKHAQITAKGQMNWTWRPEDVTCERCLAAYRKGTVAS